MVGSNEIKRVHAEDNQKERKSRKGKIREEK
jgi:hypothetical protein